MITNEYKIFISFRYPIKVWKSLKMNKQEWVQEQQEHRMRVPTLGYNCFFSKEF